MKPEARFHLKPIQPELQHLHLAYNQTFKEFKLLDTRTHAIIGPYITVFDATFLASHRITLSHYIKEYTA